tara:strand:- start:570 stop:1025 length:456 start_codon:yes stop_codon:yes gene_type:complete
MTHSGKIMRSIVTSVVATFISGATALAVPVVPNFTQGSMTSTTETTSTVTETINSIDYNTGYTYTVTGTNIKSNAGLAPSSVTGQSNTNNGVTSTWTGLNMNNRPTFSLETPGAPFQFVESYTGPGMATQTIIQREQTIQSVTTSTSIFSQ